MASVMLPRAKARRLPSFSQVLKVLKRTLLPLLAIYFIPRLFAVYAVLGLIDFARNNQRTLGSFDRYFAGNGVFTWMLSPFNLLLDVLSLPYRNKGIYELADLPLEYQEEINRVIHAAYKGDLVGKLEAKLGDKKRGMMFFKWYGKNVETSVEMPDYHQPFKYVRTIGVSIFNSRQSTGWHFGPLRVTLRVLYNVNDLKSSNVYIQVGNHTQRWRDKKLFIFDDTLQHQSCNLSEEVRYCLFVDILRPSLFPGLFRSLVTGVRLIAARCNASFYKHWTFIK